MKNRKKSSLFIIWAIDARKQMYTLFMKLVIWLDRESKRFAWINFIFMAQGTLYFLISGDI